MRADRLHKFVRRWDSRYVLDIAPGIPNPAGAQCMNGANLWLVSLGRPPHVGNAGGFLDAIEAGQYPRLRAVRNTPTGVPPRGSLVVWGYSSEMPEGHIDVFLGGDVLEFVGFDQNWPEGSPLHRQQHDYAGVIGWAVLEGLRLK